MRGGLPFRKRLRPFRCPRMHELAAEGSGGTLCATSCAVSCQEVRYGPFDDDLIEGGAVGRLRAAAHIPPWPCAVALCARVHTEKVITVHPRCEKGRRPTPSH